VATAATFALERQGDALRVGGELRIGDAVPFWRAVTVAVKDDRSGKLDIDLSGAKVVDGAMMSLLVELRADLARRGVASEIVGASREVEPVVQLYETKDEGVKPEPRAGHGAPGGRAGGGGGSPTLLAAPSSSPESSPPPPSKSSGDRRRGTSRASPRSPSKPGPTACRSCCC
jgi:ABC-type transporter Mla MlaB component